VEVDRLRPDDDYCVEVRFKGFERVEQHGASCTKKVSVARRVHWLPSNPVMLALHWAHARGP
jgi:hypothetical protein